MVATNRPPKVVVLGMGNLLLRDEGVGVHIAHALQGVSSSSDVELEVIDGGTLPDVFLSLEGVDKLVIIDAVRGGGEPGTIYRFHPEDIELESVVLTSVHHIGLLENLWLMRRLEQGPKSVVIIGVEPEDMNWGLELSSKLQQRLPQIAKVVLEEVGLEHTGERKVER